MTRNVWHRGFTLVELVIVTLVLAVLAVTATAKYVDLQREARAAVLTSLGATVEVANQHMVLLSKMPSYRARPVANRADLTDVDVDGDGTFDVFNPQSPDTRLKCSHLDNTDVVKRIAYSDDQIQYTLDNPEYLYFGFAEPDDIVDSQCYFKYTQANGSAKSCPEGVEASYEVITSGC